MPSYGVAHSTLPKVILNSTHNNVIQEAVQKTEQLDE